MSARKSIRCVKNDGDNNSSSPSKQLFSYNLLFQNIFRNQHTIIKYMHFSSICKRFYVNLRFIYWFVENTPSPVTVGFSAIVAEICAEEKKRKKIFMA